MYGMVNEGVHTFIAKNFGEDVWQAICANACVDVDRFDRMSAYDDEITSRLVSAIAKHTKMSEDAVLKVFGEYWVDFAGQSGFANLLKFAGANFIERVQNLDDMHDRVMMTMPDLRPPSFELEKGPKGAYILSYYSHREGLTSMVEGLLHGLASQTGEKVSVKLLKARGEQSEPDIFQIELLS